MTKEKDYITATCYECGKAFMREVSTGFFTQTPSTAHRCEECRKHHIPEEKRKQRKKRKYTAEQIADFKERMKKVREGNNEI